MILIELFGIIKHLQETRYDRYNIMDDGGSAEHGEMLWG